MIQIKMMKKVINNIINIFKNNKKVEYYEEELRDNTWQRSLNEILFYTGDTLEDFLLYTEENLDVDITNRINFIGYTRDFIYYPHYGESSNNFKLLPLSEYGHKLLKGEGNYTIH